MLANTLEASAQKRSSISRAPRRAPRRALLLGALVWSGLSGLSGLAGLSGCVVPTYQATLSRAPAGEAPLDRVFMANKALPAPAGARQVTLAKLVSKLARGTRVGAISAGPDCEPAKPLSWPLGLDEQLPDDLRGMLRDELQLAGYRKSESMFEESDDAQLELLLGGAVTAVALNACTGPQGDSVALSVEIEWQLYDRRTRSVVFKAATGGSARARIIRDANHESFTAALRNLLAQSAFVAAVQRMDASPQPQEPSYPLLSLSVATAGPADPARPTQPLLDARQAVVRILRGRGHGSGVIVSATGAVLTAAHVVAGLSGPVEVELADGRRVTGTIVRANEVADVALLQLPASGYPAAPIGSSAGLQIGGTVFAIGTPLQEQFGRSVTKGVVSALRPKDGRTAIQSDVGVHAGSSGGPLLDEHGRVVGLTISGATIGGGIGVGLNSFLAIDDAWRALHIVPQTAPVAAPVAAALPAAVPAGPRP
ncbi:MAG TPA: trypsin-like peptidase domain-containing protein [Kofleriaceae bacterium]|nr:trypsin-like peptidase domain-containing protein [Kofleriaceae bacterium]